MSRLLGIVAMAILARALMVTVIDGTLRHAEQSTIAANLNAGRGFVFEQYGAVYRAWKEPLYILMLAGVTRVVGTGDLTLRLFDGLFGVAAALAAALLARHIGFDRSAATLAGLIVAVNPFLLYYDTQIVHPLSMDTLLFVLTTHANVAAAEDPRGPKRRVVLAGLLTGLALWQRGILLVCGLALWAWALARDPGARRRQLGHAVIWLAFALAALAPWIIRNQVVLGRPVLTTDVPHIIWLGNNPLSNGTYSDMQGRRIFEVADPALRRRILGASELEQSAIFLGEVRRFIADHPVTFIGLAAQRAFAFVWLSPNAGLAYEAWKQIAYVIVYGVLLASGTFGFMRFWNHADRAGRGRAALVVASVAGLLAVYAVTAINLRHRVPLEVVLGIFAAGLWNVGPRRPSA